MNDSGIGWPSSSLSFGLWSNSSSWLGPPAMNRKMTAFAFGGEVRLPRRERVASRARRPASPSRASSDASAIAPRPTPQSRKKCRRVRASARHVERRRVESRRGRSDSLDARSLPRDELVEVQQHRGPTARPRGLRVGLVRCVVEVRQHAGRFGRASASRAKQSAEREVDPPASSAGPSFIDRACRAPSANSTNAGSFARSAPGAACWSGCGACRRSGRRARRTSVSSGCWRLPPEVRVHAAAVAVRRPCSRPTAWLLCVKREHFRRLRREDARAADLRRQQPARRQRRVADDLGFEPQPRSAGRAAGCAGPSRRGPAAPRRLPVGRRGDDQLVQLLEAPAAFAMNSTASQSSSSGCVGKLP